MPSGWRRVAFVFVLAVFASSSCKAAREYGEQKYDERRAVERAAEHAAEEQAAKEEAERPPPPKPAGPGLVVGTYKLREVRVEVFETNARGNAWDDPPNPGPDLGIAVKVDGKQVAKCKREDSVTATCTFEDVDVEVGAMSVIAVDVIDRDALVDDPIGGATLDGPATWAPRWSYRWWRRGACGRRAWCSARRRPGGRGMASS